MPSIVVHKLAWYPDGSPWCVQGCSAPCPTSLSPSLSDLVQAPPTLTKAPKAWHYMTLHSSTHSSTTRHQHLPQPTPKTHTHTHTAPLCTTLHHPASHTRKGAGSRACSSIALLEITRLCMTIGTNMLLLCKPRITTVSGVWPYIMA